MKREKFYQLLRVPSDKNIKLKNYDPGWTLTKELKQLGKEVVKEKAESLLRENLAALTRAQELLWASDTHSVLVIFQALDAAGKDGMIKHVMSGLNPQGCQVYSFKQPTPEELDHNFLWRCMKRLPERGRIGIFNRSYYEDVLVVRVHKELLDGQQLPPNLERKKSIWKERFEDINNFEKHLTRNGTIVVKFFLHISKDEQKRRFFERLDNPEKNWKFSPADVRERGFWDDYQHAYEEMLSATSTEYAPWYVVPADHKWASRAIVSDVLARTIESLDLHWPTLTPEQTQSLAEARAQLERE